MARSAASAGSDYLKNASDALFNDPLTLVTFFYPTRLTATETLFGSFSTDTTNGAYYHQFDGVSASDPLAARKANDTGTSAIATITTSASANTWYHTAGVFTSDTSRTSYFDGTAGTANTTSITDPGADALILFCRQFNSTTSQGFVGRLAETAVYDVALTTSEIAGMSRGVSPMLVRPTALKRYYPLFGGYSTGDESNWHGPAATLTETGTVSSQPHPSKTVSYPVP